MSVKLNALTDKLEKFIQSQKMFFVSTASADGRINLSPKGLDSLRVLSPNRLVWLNLTGSSNETAAHLLENPRMTLMFCAFEGKPLIMRLYGQAQTLHPEDPDWQAYSDLFPPMAGTRQIFDFHFDLVITSCGMGVPLMEFKQGRGEKQLEPFFARMSKSQLFEYQQKNNTLSIDGKPTDLAVSKTPQ